LLQGILLMCIRHPPCVNMGGGGGVVGVEFNFPPQILC